MRFSVGDSLFSCVSSIIILLKGGRFLLEYSVFTDSLNVDDFMTSFSSGKEAFGMSPFCLGGSLIFSRCFLSFSLFLEVENLAFFELVMSLA